MNLDALTGKQTSECPCERKHQYRDSRMVGYALTLTPYLPIYTLEVCSCRLHHRNSPREISRPWSGGSRESSKPCSRARDLLHGRIAQWEWSALHPVGYAGSPFSNLIPNLARWSFLQCPTPVQVCKAPWFRKIQIKGDR